jgi:tetratricopeptide (TPR) repeat protein
MWQAELQFKRDSFRLALDNPGGGYDGFLALIDKYGGTDAGNLAKYYAGISYLQLGEFDNAIQYLEDFDAKGSVLPAMKFGALGDAYSEKKDFGKALELYEKAADATENAVVAPIYLKKLGMLNELQGNKDAARKAYERIKKDFPNQASTDWREIDKYIYRLQ